MTTRTLYLIGIILLALPLEAHKVQARTTLSSSSTSQTVNLTDGHGHRQNGPEACRHATISTLRAWGNSIENLGMAMLEKTSDTWFIRIDDLTHPEPWRAAVSLGICTARQEDGFWRVETLSLRPAHDPVADCVAAMLQAGARWRVADVRIDGTLQDPNGVPVSIITTLFNADGHSVASGTCPLITTPEGAFMIAPGQAEAIHRSLSTRSKSR